MDGETNLTEQFVANGQDLFLLEGGKKYRIPYHVIKRAIFLDIKKEHLIDVSHSARLQYKLLLMDSVVKAVVDFNQLRITVIYNPIGADNNGAKTSVESLVKFLAQEGVHVHPGSTKDENYDYYKELYSYAFSSPSIRKSAPYSFTLKEWETLEPEFIKKSTKADRDKLAKFNEWREKYKKEKNVGGAQSATSQISNLLGL